MMALNVINTYPDGGEVGRGRRDVSPIDQRLSAGLYQKASMDASHHARLPGSHWMEQALVLGSPLHSNLERGRLGMRQELARILETVFDLHSLSTDDGLDVGSGPSGYMVQQILPLSDAERASWIQMDLHPGAVAALQSRYAQANVEHGSYLGTGMRDRFAIVTGLSALDSTTFLDDAIEEVRQNLKIGGHLLHFQDVLPAWMAPLQEVHRMGEASPWNVMVDPSNPVLPHSAIMYEVADQQGGRRFENVMELFRQRLARVIEENPGMELLEDEWFTAVTPLSGAGQGAIYDSGYKVVPPDSTERLAAGIITLAKRVA